MNSYVAVRFYRLTLREAWGQGAMVAFYCLLKKLLRLGYYGHVSIIVATSISEVEYTLTEDGLISYYASETENLSNDTFVLTTVLEPATVLSLIEMWGRHPSPVTVLSLAKALSRPNCSSTRGCCTHFVSYVLSLPPVTLADELCQMILSSDTKHVRNVAPETTSECGALQRAKKNATALAVKRKLELRIIRKCLGLYDCISMLLYRGEGLLRRLRLSTMFSKRGK